MRLRERSYGYFIRKRGNVMPLYLAAVLFIALAAGITVLIALARRNGIKKRTVAAICVSAVILSAALIYILLTLIFIFAADNKNVSGEPPKPTATESDVLHDLQNNLSALQSAENPALAPETLMKKR